MPGNGVCKPSRNTCWNVVKSEFTHDKARSLPTRTTCGGDTPGLFVHQTQLFVRWRRRALASYRVRRVPDIAGAAEDCVCIHCLSVQWLLHVRAVAGSQKTEASVMSRITWPEGKILSQNPRSRLLFRQDLYKYVNYWPVGVQDGRWLGQESLVLYAKMRHQAVMEGSSPSQWSSWHWCNEGGSLTVATADKACGRHGQHQSSWHAVSLLPETRDLLHRSAFCFAHKAPAQFSSVIFSWSPDRTIGGQQTWLQAGSCELYSHHRVSTFQPCTCPVVT